MALIFTGIPWKDGERTEYVVKAREPQGETKEIGKITYRLEEQGQENSRESVIKLNSCSEIFPNNFKDDSETTVIAADFRPLTYKSTLSTPQGEVKIEAEYGGKKVKAVYHTPGGTKHHKIKFSGICYDNSSIIHLLRCIDYHHLDDSQKFNLVNVASAQTLLFSLTYEGDEKVMVPAGEFDCYRIRFTLHDLPQEVPPQFFLYTTSPPRLFIKNVNGPQTIELNAQV